jgi:hypothetical protein
LLGAALLLAPAAHGSLTHRYSFNDGTANDSVGGAHGVPIHSPQVAGGSVNFANNGLSDNPLTGQYIDLPNQIARTPALTLETWVTYRGGRTFQEIASFGTGSAGELQPDTPNPATGAVYGTDYIALIPSMNYNNREATYGTIRRATPEEQPTGSAAPMSLNAEHHLVYAVDYPGRTSVLYIDGQEVGRRTITIDPSLHDQVNDWLGRSQWSPDPFFNGSINEFRIYDHALSASDAAASFAAGPDAVVPEPSSAVLFLIGALPMLRRRR